MNERFMFRVWDKQEKILIENVGVWGKQFLCWFDSVPEDWAESVYGICSSEDNWRISLEDNPDRFTIEQCTGQNAMSGGGLVFEGDLIDVYNPMTDAWNRCVVKWEDDASGYVCLYVNPDIVERGCWLASESGTYFDGGYCRIVGNIHELKEGK